MGIFIKIIHEIEDNDFKYEPEYAFLTAKYQMNIILNCANRRKNNKIDQVKYKK